MASRMKSTRLRQPSSSRTVAAILRLEAMAAHAIGNQHILAARVRHQLDALQDRDFGPRTVPFCRREIVSGVLIGGELHAGLGDALKPSARIDTR